MRRVVAPAGSVTAAALERTGRFGYLSEADGVSHSLVVHELWVLVVVGSNPTTPTVCAAEAPAWRGRP